MVQSRRLGLVAITPDTCIGVVLSGSRRGCHLERLVVAGLA